MSKKKNQPSEQPPMPPNQETPNPALEIEVEVRGKGVWGAKNLNYWGLYEGVVVKTFDYRKKWSKDDCSPDDQDGELCKQTTYSGQNLKIKDEDKLVFRIYIREGQVFRIIMPPGGLVVVKTYKEWSDDQPQEVRRWVHKKKS